MTGTVALILLIVVANVTNLLLARVFARARELSMRTALGASPARLSRQLVVETLLLSLCGGLLGIGVAALLSRGLVEVLPQNLPRLESVGLHPVVLGGAPAVMLGTGLVVGLFSAHGTARPSIKNQLSASGRSITSTASKQRLRSSLVVVEMTLAVVLLVGATILTRSMAETLRVDPGFEAEGLVHFSLLPRRQERTAQEVEDDHRRLRASLAALPGV